MSRIGHKVINIPAGTTVEVNGNTVVVNMKRVTADQAKRIVDFLSGTVYALSGDLQKIGAGIFLCTPKEVDVEGAITDDEEKGKKVKNDIDLDW